MTSNDRNLFVAFLHFIAKLKHMIKDNHILLSLLIILIMLVSCTQKKESNLDYVDPSIGGVGVILEPTRPTVHLPNSMVRVFPNRKDQLDDQISNFHLTITSHRLYKVFGFMPVCGTVNADIWDKRYEYGAEELTPYYYRTSFEDYGNSIEFTPQAKSGYFKLNFVDSSQHFIRMGVLNGEGEIRVEGKRLITGIDEFAGMKAYFYAELDTDISKIEYQNSLDKKKLLIGIGKDPQEVSFRYGMSYISIEQAKQNLQNEIPEWDFESTKNNAFQIWDEAFSQINIEGGTDAQKRVFYTALYRSYERMVDINEYGKYYSAYDHKVHETDEPFFVDNWIWDNYIALEPLHMILNPDMA
ncbi:MAG: glycoside hydrolase family 92 protein, partial [Bacteroidales bacterium]|nr:glycoside hydrolase family 92 protein [Bacteroidales bacterium]